MGQQVKELLIDRLQDLLHAESQLVGALQKTAQAADHPKLKEAFEKHWIQKQGQVERLREIFELLGEKAEPKPCEAVMGLLEEGGVTLCAPDEADLEAAFAKPSIRRAPIVAAIRAADGSTLELDADNNVSVGGTLFEADAGAVEEFIRLAGERGVDVQ